MRLRKKFFPFSSLYLPNGVIKYIRYYAGSQVSEGSTTKSGVKMGEGYAPGVTNFGFADLKKA